MPPPVFDPRSQAKPRPELEVRVHSLPVAQPRGCASDSKDGSFPSVTPHGVSAVASRPTATPRRLGDGGPPAVVHVFSGPDNRVDGLAAYLSKLGVPCVDLDIVNYRQGEIKSSHDLSSDSLWETLRSELEGGRILALWFGTPCSTFSKARGHGAGPRPLRSVQHIYRLPKSELRDSEYQQVREGTYFALKPCELAQAAHRQGVCFGIENPEPWPGHVSLYLLPEMQALAEKDQSTLLSTAEAPYFDENHTFVATCICICLLGHVFTCVLLVLHVVWLRSWVQCGWCSVL